jgi:hypothetical protein
VGVSNETVIYAYGFCATLTSQDFTANYSPILLSEKAPCRKEEESNCQIREVKIGAQQQGKLAD